MDKSYHKRMLKAALKAADKQEAQLSNKYRDKLEQVYALMKKLDKIKEEAENLHLRREEAFDRALRLETKIKMIKD